jgi:hypothetical protein
MPFKSLGEAQHQTEYISMQTQLKNGEIGGDQVLQYESLRMDQ